MLMYFLIALSLVLVGVVGLQFFYMFYIERMYQQRRIYLKELEKKHAVVCERLAAAERRVAEQDDLLATVYPEYVADDEVWADVIDGDIGR
jgi:hypothetical protein